ncbi:MAG: flagellar hook-basal body protein [Planctomycetota bacterium]
MVNFSIAVSALRAVFDRQANTANNIANVNTSGFKSSRVHQQESYGGGVHIAAVHRDLTQGPLQPTGRALDIAVAGGGYLAVDTPRGQRFTRFGAFGLDAEGSIVDAAGNRLAPGLQVPADAVAVNISRSGAVSATMQDGTTVEVGRVEVYTFANAGGLQALGGGLFAPTGASGPAAAGVAGQGSRGELIAGFLEGSNVSLAREITDQIVNRATLAANTATIRAQDGMLGELLDTVR